MASIDGILVTKRNGGFEPFWLEKIHKVLFWATEDIAGVSVSEIEISLQLQIYNKINTTEIQEALIKATADLISEETPNYQWVAARLINISLRKQVYGSYEPPILRHHVIKCIGQGVYDKDLLSLYTEVEWDRLERIIKHKRDNNLSFAAMEQFRGKYLVQDRTNHSYFETPQMAYLLVAAILFAKYPDDTRMQYVKDFYDAISKGPKSTITMATPILSGVRTPTRQFSSCVLIETGDNIDSINETASAIVDYASRRAGIGINAGRIRAEGSKVKGGEVFHTGNIPFYKYFHGALKSCSQGGVRGASATVYYPIWHYEVEGLLVLKNNKGTDETRVRHMDYGIQLNGYLYQRLIDGKDITLFSPHDVPELYEAFFCDQKKFAELYEKSERMTSIRKKSVSAFELISTMLVERNNTGRIYIQHVDHTNIHGAFNCETSPIRMSNLCVEVTTPTAPLTRKSRIPYIPKFYEEAQELSVKNFRDEYGEISLCTLGSINLGAIHEPEDFEQPCDLIVRALNEILDYQDYPMIAAGVPARARRNLGVGVSNLAYLIAKNGLKFSDGSANELVNEYAESMLFYLLQASNECAKETGPCDWYDETKYSNGILPIDSYKPFVDTLVKTPLHKKWKVLRNSITKHGLKNSTVMALPPVESSSQPINATNGIEPPRSAVSVKTSKHGTLKQVVPEIFHLKNKYEYTWDMPHTRGYLELAAIFQKYADQSVSTNTSYNPTNYEGDKVPMSELLGDLVYSYKLGLKTLYYQNTWDGAGEVEFEEEGEEECSSCVL